MIAFNRPLRNYAPCHPRACEHFSFLSSIPFSLYAFSSILALRFSLLFFLNFPITRFILASFMLARCTPTDKYTKCQIRCKSNQFYDSTKLESARSNLISHQRVYIYIYEQSIFIHRFERMHASIWKRETFRAGRIRRGDPALIDKRMDEDFRFRSRELIKTIDASRRRPSQLACARV